MDPNNPSGQYQAPQPAAQNTYQQNPQTPPPTMYGRASKKAFTNPLEVMQPGERVICHIQRHPFGLIGLYIITGALLLATIAAAILVPHYVTMTSQQKTYAGAGALFVAAVIGIYLYIAVTIYNGNRWIVTSDSITQITQTGLFRKQSSQLSLGNLEDVTYEQNNFIQSMFGFGTLHVETAGEHSKFIFPFCPTPQQCAVEIIQAHEQYVAANPERELRDNQGLTNPPGSGPMSTYPTGSNPTTTG